MNWYASILCFTFIVAVSIYKLNSYSYTTCDEANNYDFGHNDNWDTYNQETNNNGPN